MTTTTATEAERLAGFYQEMANVHVKYAEQIRSIERKYGVGEDILRLGYGDLPDLVRGLLSNPKYQETGMRLKNLTKILWDKGYRTNRGPAHGPKAKKNLYQMVYQSCTKMIDDEDAVNVDHKYQLTEGGLKKAGRAA